MIPRNAQPNLGVCPPRQPGFGGKQEDLNPPKPGEPGYVPPGGGSGGGGPPAGGPPWDFHSQINELQPLCCHGLDQPLVTAVILRLLEVHFAQPGTIMDPLLKGVLWTPDVTTSKIRIATNLQVSQVQAGMLPALIVRRGAFTSERKVTNDLNEATAAEQHAGEEQFVRWVKGTHMIYCVANTDGISDAYATEVFDFLTYLTPAIRSYLPFDDFEINGADEPTPLEELGNIVGVGVRINYIYQYGWSLSKIAPRFKIYANGTPF